MKKIISIVVPAYYEEKTIGSLLSNISKTVKTPHEILIVYDLKNDPTLNAAKTYIKNSKTKNIHLTLNSKGNGRGVTNAIKTGFEKAKGEAVVVVMADLSDDLTDIDRMAKKIHDGSDIVCGSRYMPGGRKIGGPLLKSLLSRIAGLTLYYFFKMPTHDATNAFKMYRKKLLEQIRIESTGGFEYSMEITLRSFKKGYIISEIPTIWHDRTQGKSNFKLLHWLPKYIKTYFLVFTNDSIDSWRRKAGKNISIEENLIILFICFLISLAVYLFIILNLHLKFEIPQTTAINWLTINHYPKQQDYYFFYSLVGFNAIFSFLLWFLWISLKIKKR